MKMPTKSSQLQLALEFQITEVNHKNGIQKEKMDHKKRKPKDSLKFLNRIKNENQNYGNFMV